MTGAATALIADATRAFLRRHAPFDAMTDAALDWAIARMSLAYFAKDATILTPASGPVAHLYIIQRGRVGSRPDDPRAPFDPTLGPGELFPVGALSAGGATTKIFHAVEDAFCYQLARDDFLELRRRSAELERYCTQAITETLKQSLAQLAIQYGQRAAEQQTLTRPLGELLRRAPVTAVATAPVRDALEAMKAAAVRTVIVVDEREQPVGVFTLVDLLRRVTLDDRSLATPIAEVMSAPAVTLPAGASAYEAMHLMAERAVRQIVVVDGGRACGMVNERDLFALQRVSMRQVIEALRDAKSIEALKRAAEDIRGLTRNLLAQGVGAEPLTRTIASLNDGLARRAVDLAGAHPAIADIDWCWLALGSEGRGEQTFATDQDNGIVFVPAREETVAGERARLMAFAAEVNDSLATLGFPLCTGGVMARNAHMCLALHEWKARFLEWISAPTPQALLQANILFDFRALYGDATLADRLREWLLGYTQASEVFLRLLVQNALEATPPLGLIHAFTVDEEPPHRGTLDLKVRGTRIFVDAARAFALGLGVAETGTAARLRVAGTKLGVPERHVESTVDAFHFLQLLRLRQQDVAGEHGIVNRLDPATLNEVDQRMLKEAFRQARKLQQRLAQTFRA
jgi:CBS domain-containing protein